MIALWILLGVFVVLLIAGLIVFFVASAEGSPVPLESPQKLNKFVGKTRAALALETVEWLKDHPCQDLSMESFDGVKLKGRWLPVNHARGTILVLHGWHGSPETDFCQRLQLYHDLGFNLLLAHQRGQNGSGGRFMTFGVKESVDAACWVRFHNENLSQYPVILSGVSMGAATAMMTMGQDLPGNVRGVIADCGFTSPWEILCAVGRSYHICPFPLLYITKIWFRVLGGYDPKKHSAIACMKKSKLPILLIHGKKDHFVPCSMSEAVYAAYEGEKTLVLVENAGHTMSYATDMPRCRREIEHFLNRILEK